MDHQIHERLKQAAADEARRQERKRRHKIDDLRYALKKVQRHLDVEMSYDEALPHIQDLTEFKDILEEEDRRSAFGKYIKRQKVRCYEFRVRRDRAYLEIQEKLREAESSEVGSNRDDRDRHHREDPKDRHATSKDKMDVDEEEDDDTKDKERDREKTKKAKYDEKFRERDRDRERDREHRSRRDSERDHRDRDRDRDRDHKDRSERSGRDRDRDREESDRGDRAGKDREREKERKERKYSKDSTEPEERDVKVSSRPISITRG